MTCIACAPATSCNSPAHAIESIGHYDYKCIVDMLIQPIGLVCVMLSIRDFFSAHELLSACILHVFFFFFFFFYAFCAFVYLYYRPYHIVVKAVSIDRYSCLSGSLSLLFLNTCAILCVF